MGYRRGKIRAGKKKKEVASREKEDSDPPNSTSGEHSDNHQDENEPPRSPASSEISSAATTESTSGSISGSMSPTVRTVLESVEDTILRLPQKSISAKIEILQGGCLAGDSFPVRVSIKHNTAVKSMQGIIITLYRQGRIDTHPAIPLGPRRPGEKPKYEDYYPKSFTGLGGLSLTSAGSSRSFRQDLNQIFAPLIVDPQTLTAVICTSIQAPVHLFPTITCVPGGMVSFKYYVEVVVDLRAKIGSQDRLRPHMSMTSTLQHGYGDAKMTRIESPDGVSYAATPGFNYLVTDQLRRTKGVVFTRTEILVGTKDSSRKLQKQREDQSSVNESSRSSNVSAILGIEITPHQDLEHGCCKSCDGVNQLSVSFAHDSAQQPMASVPPPEVEEELDEKTRLRRAEERLLPSAPPQDDDSSISMVLLPSAPVAIDEEDFVQRYGGAHPAPAYDSPSSPHVDKLEAERQRLLARVSAPDAEDVGVEGGASSEVGNSHVVQPTAPALYEDDVFDINDPRIPQAPVEHEPHPARPSVLEPDHLGPQSLHISDGPGLAQVPTSVDEHHCVDPLTSETVLPSEGSHSLDERSCPPANAPTLEYGDDDDNNDDNDDLPLYKE